MQVKSKLRRWGNSFGVVVPREVVEKEGLKEGELVEISVRKASDIRRLFGKYPFKNLQQQKETMRKGWEGGPLKLSLPITKARRRAALRSIAGIDSQAKSFIREKRDRF